MTDKRVIVGEFVEQVDKNIEPVQVLEDKIIKCDSCGKKLIEVIVIDNKDLLNKVRVTCKCGSRGFWHIFKDSIFWISQTRLWQSWISSSRGCTAACASRGRRSPNAC